MREPALLFEPIVDIRDVLESFLVNEVVVTDWQETLAAAAARLSELGRAWSDTDLLELARVTQELSAERLDADSALVRIAADGAAKMLDQARVPGVPRPEDDDWAF
ncbi:hypothetical protein [Mycobacterium noviomagense]|uniref:Uncharacterized protein n=1 Tax=Mycobacterium noviomagense TaxID=459858 RepID=A0A7I7PCR1_9MYCO|nr:hypothetical protein [Mycobacterium noviomagense]ORB13966.1 hypothetical protein BST37_12195 [Mycobacterium noviomagense]BBY06380.1 hypothetical protein MNVI_16980 [Mycobacterium noviomagense]